MKKLSIPAIILAGGESKRMKDIKLLLSIKDKPLIYWCLESLYKADIQDIIVVLGKYYNEIINYISLLNFFNLIDILINHNFIKGMGSSLLLGLEEVEKRLNVSGVLITLADKPFITSSILRKIINIYYNLSYENKKKSIIVPYYKDKPGHPVIIGSKYFKELKESLKGDIGARYIIKKYEKRIIKVTLDNPEVLIDIDTQEDLYKWKEYIKKYKKL